MKWNLERLREMAARFGDETPAEVSEVVKFFEGIDLEKVTEVEEAEPLSFASTAFLDKMKSLMEGSGKFSPDEMAEFFRHSRAYAGGVASAEKRRASTQDDPEVEALIAASEARMQFPGFSDVSSLKFSDELTPWMQITPAAGSTFKHPKYGDITFDQKKAEEMVQNFNAGVYQKHIPVDAEHQTKLSGALGYFREMRVRGDGAVEARVELSERGRSLMSNGNFRYFSPEFYPTWEDPGTGRTFNNVLIGGAFTTRPFFKDKHLAEVVAANEFEVWATSEGEVPVKSRYQKDAQGNLVLDADGNPQLTDEAKAADAEALKASEAAAVKAFRDEKNLTDEAIAGLSVKKEEDEKAKAFAEQFPEEAKALSEARALAERLEAEARERKFSEMIEARSGDKESRPWVGGTAEHLGMLNSLAKAFGEDSTEFKSYVNQQNQRAVEASKSQAFKETGSSAKGGAKTAEDLAREKVTASGGKMQFHEALNEVLREKPELYSGEGN